MKTSLKKKAHDIKQIKEVLMKHGIELENNVFYKEILDNLIQRYEWFSDCVKSNRKMMKDISRVSKTFASARNKAIERIKRADYKDGYINIKINERDIFITAEIKEYDNIPL